jgi:hypothetical protein
VSDSYPPYLLRLPGSAPGSPARGRLEGGRPAQPVQLSQVAISVPPALVATPGTPGTYEPPVTPGERPRTIAELQARVTPVSPQPWPADAYLPMGERGKRAHWTGSSWKGGVSPGYAGELATVRSATEQTGSAEQ